MSITAVLRALEPPVPLKGAYHSDGKGLCVRIYETLKEYPCYDIIGTFVVQCAEIYKP